MARVFADRPFELIPTPSYRLARDKKADEYTEMATEMANVHNFILRGLNAICLQAPHIPDTPQDQKAFCNFVHQWYRCLQAHHDGEEETFFPEIERRTGIRGIMDGNIAQHAQFEQEIDQLNAYVLRCIRSIERREKKKKTSRGGSYDKKPGSGRRGRGLTRKITEKEIITEDDDDEEEKEEEETHYDGNKIVSIINTFGAVLRQHLADEIPTVLSLRDHSAHLAGLQGTFRDKVGATHMTKSLGLFRGGVCVMATHDVEFERGLHRDSFPAGSPRLLVWFLRKVAWWAHADWWKFAPCDRSGKMRPLRYAGSGAGPTRASAAAAGTGTGGSEVREEETVTLVGEAPWEWVPSRDKKNAEAAEVEAEVEEEEEAEAEAEEQEKEQEQDA